MMWNNFKMAVRAPPFKPMRKARTNKMEDGQTKNAEARVGEHRENFEVTVDRLTHDE